MGGEQKKGGSLNFGRYYMYIINNWQIDSYIWQEGYDTNLSFYVPLWFPLSIVKKILLRVWTGFCFKIVCSQF